MSVLFRVHHPSPCLPYYSYRLESARQHDFAVSLVLLPGAGHALGGGAGVMHVPTGRVRERS